MTKINSLEEPVEGSCEQKLLCQLLHAARLWLEPLLGEFPYHWLSGERHRGSYSSTLCDRHGQNRLALGANLVHFAVKWLCVWRNIVQKLFHLAIVGAGARGTGGTVVKLGWFYAFDDRISLSLLGQITFDRSRGSHGGMWWFESHISRAMCKALRQFLSNRMSEEGRQLFRDAFGLKIGTFGGNLTFKRQVILSGFGELF